MKVLFIAKNSLDDYSIKSQLKDVCEEDSIVIHHTFHSAVQFIDNNLIANQLPIDLIISQSNVDNANAKDFVEKIKKDENRTYSQRDFNFYMLPVVLIADTEENANAYSSYPFSEAFDDIGFDRLHLRVNEIRSVVKDWRKNVVTELDSLGVKFNNGRIDYSYLLSRKKRLTSETKILSRNFHLFPRRLNYEWLRVNQRQIEIAIDSFIKEIKRATRSAKREERRFHDLFNKYPFLLKRDNYSEHWYEAKLDLPDGESYKPDYSLKPNFNQNTDLSIVEVKLPNEGFITKDPFHPSPYASLMKHIFQVNDYKDYLESDEYQSEIEKTFGFIPRKIEYNILVGRSEDKLDNLSAITKRMRQINGLHVNLMTYDELLDYQLQFFDRMGLLQIF